MSRRLDSATPHWNMTMTSVSTHSLRKLLEKHLRTDDDFEAFCIDHFPGIYKRFSSQMTRTTKINLLLTLEDDHSKVLAALENYCKATYGNHVIARVWPLEVNKFIGISIAIVGSMLIISWLGVTAFHQSTSGRVMAPLNTQINKSDLETPLKAHNPHGIDTALSYQTVRDMSTAHTIAPTDSSTSTSDNKINIDHSTIRQGHGNLHIGPNITIIQKAGSGH